MWIGIGIGAAVLVVAVAIAVVPVLVGSLRYHQRLHERSERSRRPRRPVPLRADCPVCAAHLEATGEAALVRTKNRHMVRRHSTAAAAAQAERATSAVSRSA